MYNTNLDKLTDYPFDRLRTLLKDINSPKNKTPMIMSLGEPQHTPPTLLAETINKCGDQWAKYPPMVGSSILLNSIERWLVNNYGLVAKNLDPSENIVAVSGTREALYMMGAIAIPPQKNDRQPLVLMPNPFYQVYMGAAEMARSKVILLPAGPETGFQPDFSAIEPKILERTALAYINSPANPQGSTADKEFLVHAAKLAQKYDFVLAIDECYSEIYSSNHNKPNSLLKISENIGNKSFEKCIIFHSLSKRSNLPGLRSGFVAGDSNLLKQYFLYRTYHGCAMAGHTQEISALAWSDESHVDENRDKYTKKFSVVEEILKDHYKIYRPEGGFYHWIKTPIDDQQFAARLMETHNVKVMPGSFLSREDNGEDPGLDHIRVAWVSEKEECIEAARRLVEFARGL